MPYDIFENNKSSFKKKLPGRKYENEQIGQKEKAFSAFQVPPSILKVFWACSVIYNLIWVIKIEFVYSLLWILLTNACILCVGLSLLGFLPRLREP